MKFLNFITQTPFIILIVISLIIVFVFGWILIWPKYQEIGEVRVTIKQKQEEIVNIKEHLSKLRLLKDQLDNYQTEIANIDNALPSDPSIPSLYNFLQQATAGSGLILTNISSFNISQLAQNPNINGIKIQMTVAGSYAAFKNFLYTLENSARMVDVENISFSSPSGEEGLFSFAIEIQTHSY